MIEQFGPDGLLAVEMVTEPIENGYGMTVDYEYRRIGDIRFDSVNGERFENRDGVFKWLDRHGWPPLAVGSVGAVGSLVCDILPPPALTVFVRNPPGVDLWRLTDIDAWRKAAAQPEQAKR